MQFKNKVAVITGGSSGIGKGIASYFANQGAQVLIMGRNQQSLAQAAQEIGHGVVAIQGDVSNKADLQKLYALAQEKFGKIDILIANAGVSKRLPVDEVDEDEFDRQMLTNYHGVYFTVKHALPFLHAGASIILIASSSAAIALKNHSVYASTKAAVVKLAKNFAIDLGPKQIRVNSISPGYVRTPIFDERLKTDPDYLKRREAIIPLGRIGKPEDIAHAAAFLASDAASYITGIDLIVDGGLTPYHTEP